MKLIFIYISVLIFISTTFNLKADTFNETQRTIDVRKTAMQSLWQRVKRLSPYVELKEKVDYNKKLATIDANEILQLLEKTRNLWPTETNISGKGFTNATPAVWALPKYFDKLYATAEYSAGNLKQSIIEDDIEKTTIAMCNLGKACGTCHASFRRLLTSQLANEVNGWSGKYVKDCK